MHVVHLIFEAFGGVNAVAEKAGVPQQTASEWRTRNPPEIPPWRRPSILDAARRDDSIDLPSDAIAYLVSNARQPRDRKAA